MTDREIEGRRILSVLIAVALLCSASLIIFGEPAALIIFGFMGICGAIAVLGALFLLVVAPWLPKGVRDRWDL